MIQLNEYDSKNLPFVEVVEANTRNLSDLDKHLENGDCVFLLDVIDEYENSPQSFVYLVLLREKQILHDKIDDLPLDKRYIKTTYLCVSKGDSRRIIPAGDWDENEPFVTCVEECGYNCAVPIRALRH